MSNSDSNEPSISEAHSLDDLVITYDMRKLRSEALAEFETAIASQEHMDQSAIGHFFNLGDEGDARN